MSATSRESWEAAADFGQRAFSSVPALFTHCVAHHGDRPALRHKERGVWRTRSWRSVEHEVQSLAHGLGALGIGADDVAAVLAENRPEWFLFDLAIQSLGAATCGVYPTSAAEQVGFVLAHSTSKVVIVEDDEQLQKVLAVRERCPHLRAIVLLDDEGVAVDDLRGVIAAPALRQQGEESAARDCDRFARWRDSVRPEHRAVLLYTSGTTGAPKGAVLEHRQLLFQAFAGQEILDVRSEDRLFSFLPLSHIAERMFNLVTPLTSGACVHFAEEPETVFEDLREIQPTVLFGPPRFWEKLYAGITRALSDATSLQRRGFALATAVTARARRPHAHIAMRMAASALSRTVLGNVRRSLGLDSARRLFSAAAPISPELVRWLRGLDLPMVELYGLTETCGLATGATVHEARPGTVGPALRGTELRIADDGEILIRGPHIFSEYLHEEAVTAETIDREGWLHTGDLGALDPDGHLRITGRRKDVLITAGGKNVAPAALENELKFSPLLADAVVLGDGQRYLVALLLPDRDNLEQWARERRVPYVDLQDLVRRPEVQALMESTVSSVNERFSRAEQIKQFHLLDRELDPEDEEVTPTMKLKRAQFAERYRDQVDAMYREHGR